MKLAAKMLLQASRLVFLMLMATPAMAHVNDETIRQIGPLLAGLSHPVMGPDHFLAMVSVGIVSAVLGGRHFWLVPLAFVCSMPIGWQLGRMAASFPPTEFGIALSVVALGLGGLFAPRLPVGWVYAAVAGFALFHGHAHGSEMPPALDPIQYAAGFLIGTATLHLLGLFLGDILHQRDGRNKHLAVLNIGIAGAGIYFLLAPAFIP
jgi:urease accessory protein